MKNEILQKYLHGDGHGRRSRHKDFRIKRRKKVLGLKDER